MPDVLETLKKLPEYCFAHLPSNNTPICIHRGEIGYTPIPSGARDLVDAENARLGITPAQREAMLAGSMWGWEIPAANPDIYDSEGKIDREKLKGLLKGDRRHAKP